MDQLLPHYERELSLLRERSQAFAQRYPKVAGALQMRGDIAQDPHVERMIESFALLAARVHKRLDDDFPLFTESLLEVLYPHYLRPFPSCSVAQLDVGPMAGQMSKAVRVERGTLLHSRPVRGVPCRFRTTQDVQLLPIQLTHASFRNALQAPSGTRLPAQATSVLSLTLALQSPQATWGLLAEQPLRLYLDGEPSQVSVLREALTRRVVGTMVQRTPHQPWLPADQGQDGTRLSPRLVGFEDEEALIDSDARSHPAYRLLTEYFAFPDKFNFIDLPLRWPAGAMRGDPASEGGLGPSGSDASGAAAPRLLTVHLLMSGIRSDSDEARLLESVHARNLVLGCTPVVNLFQQPADPIRVTQTASSYPVLVDGRRAFAYEVYSIDRVFRVQQTPQGESVQAFKPFFSLQHDELLGPDDAEAQQGHTPAGSTKVGGRYWSTHRDEDVALASPGYELELSIVDIDFDPAAPQTDTLSLTVTATNRDLPSLLPFGAVGGDLFMEGGGPAKEIRLLRKPTASQRFDLGRGALWRLISHLSLNHLSLSAGGLDALKEMLRLYDLPRSAINRRQVDGLSDITFKPATAWLPGEPYATFVRGTEVRLTVDEDSFVGTGLGLFAAVLDRFFGLYVHANSFVQLTLLSARTQEVVHTCPPRNGDLTLL
jgi:type VI secretion system protein ImpG